MNTPGERKRKTDSREKILKAAIGAFSKNGFHQTSMDSIADSAGVAKGTLYYNFPNKSSLFAAAVTNGIDTIIEEIMRQLDSDLPFEQHLRLLVKTNVELFLQHRDLTKILFNELSNGLDPKVLSEIENARKRYIGFMSEILLEGKNMGYLDFEDDGLTAVALVGLLDSLCNHHLKHPRKTPKKQIVNIVHKLLTGGLLSR